MFHQDSDSDGYGNPTVSIKLCGATAPAGYVADGSDCCDTDNKAHPGQASYFAFKNLCNSFDYDCINGEQMDPATSATVSYVCNLTAVTCTVQRLGWVDPPSCGSAGYYASGTCHVAGEALNHCTVDATTHPAQACR